MSKNVPVQRPIVYDGGFSGFKVDTGDYPDIIGHLFSEFLKDRQEKKKPSLKKAYQDQLLEFVEFARQYLDKNPPRTQRYIGRGIGLELQNGAIVALSTQDATVVEYRADSVSVTTAKSQPGQNGISDTYSIPITTGQVRVQDARAQDQSAGQGKAVRSKQ